jgi:hypothetical protein
MMIENKSAKHGVSEIALDVAAVFLRCNTKLLPEYIVHVCLAGETTPKRDVSERHLGLPQQLLRSAKPPLQHVLVRRQPSGCTKHAKEVGSAIAALSRQRSKRKVCVQFGIDPIPYSPENARRQRLNRRMLCILRPALKEQESHR